MMLIALSWKNIWRNKTRSMVVIVSVTLGTVAGVFVAGLMNGWLNQRINSVVYTEIGHLKIQNPNYLVNEEAQYCVQNIDSLTTMLKNSSEVLAYSTRSKILAMASTAHGSTGIVLKGIDPDKEKAVSDIYKFIVNGGGTYFNSSSKLPQVLISNKTAETLRIRNFQVTYKTLDSLNKLNVPRATSDKLIPLLGQRFATKKKFETEIQKKWKKSEIDKYAAKLIGVASFYQPRAKINFSFTKANGEIGYQTFQVVGIFKTSNASFDQMSAFVSQHDLALAAGMAENQYHEVSIILQEGKSNLNYFQKIVANRFKQQSVLTWKTLASDAGMMSEFMTVYYYIIMGIIFFALAFGIINTMLMSILERVKELGMLMAIGMKKSKVFSMIMLETIFLTLTGSVLGMLLGAALIAITNKTGLNFTSVAEGFEAMGWSSTVYPTIDALFFMGVTVMVITIAILASIIPARKALKLNTVESLRNE